MRDIPSPMTENWLCSYMLETDEQIYEPFEEEVRQGFCITVYVRKDEMPVEVELPDSLIYHLIDEEVLLFSTQSNQKTNFWFLAEWAADMTKMNSERNRQE